MDARNCIHGWIDISREDMDTLANVSKRVHRFSLSSHCICVEEGNVQLRFAESNSHNADLAGAVPLLYKTPHR
jgi:hypothetical protein